MSEGAWNAESFASTSLRLRLAPARFWLSWPGRRAPTTEAARRRGGSKREIRERFSGYFFAFAKSGRYWP